MDLDHGESMSQNIEGKIKKATHVPPKFDTTQQKQFLCDARRALKKDITCK
jgi:hypothetical protein